MRDRRLRELRRRARSEAALAGALMLEEARCGHLQTERLELAAYLGDPAARHALGAPASPAGRTLHRHVRGLGRWGREPVLLAALALAEHALERDQPTAHLRAQGYVLERAATAVRELLACPCPDHRRRLEALSRPRGGAGSLLAAAAASQDARQAARLAAKAVRYLYPSKGGLTYPALRRRVRQAVLPWALR